MRNSILLRIVTYDEQQYCRNTHHVSYEVTSLIGQCVVEVPDVQLNDAILRIKVGHCESEREGQTQKEQRKIGSEAKLPTFFELAGVEVELAGQQPDLLHEFHFAELLHFQDFKWLPFQRFSIEVDQLN